MGIVRDREGRADGTAPKLRRALLINAIERYLRSMINHSVVNLRNYEINRQFLCTDDISRARVTLPGFFSSTRFTCYRELSNVNICKRLANRTRDRLSHDRKKICTIELPR